MEWWLWESNMSLRKHLSATSNKWTKHAPAEMVDYLCNYWKIIEITVWFLYGYLNWIECGISMRGINKDIVKVIYAIKVTTKILKKRYQSIWQEFIFITQIVLNFLKNLGLNRYLKTKCTYLWVTMFCFNMCIHCEIIKLD
jgi:hypothetical protein